MPIANPAYLKYPYQRISHWSLNVFPRQVVATAEIATTYSVVDFPRADFTTTSESAGWLTDVYPDMLVEITRAGAVIYRGSIRKPPVATVLYVAGMVYGDTGQMFDDATPILDGDIVTIYSVRIPWAYWSVIDLDTRLTYRKWDLEVWYEDEPTVSRNAYPQPVANLGSWQRGEVDSITGVATLTHSAAASTVWRGTGFTVDWILPTGATLVGGYALTDEAIEVEYDAGVYLIGCTVTETGGAGMDRSRTAWRYVWAIDGTTVFDTSDTIAIEPPSADTHIFNEGRVMSLRFTGTGAALRSVLYTGAPVLMTTQYQYSNDGWVTSVALAAADALEYFAGYVTDFTSISDTGDIQTVEVSVANVLTTCRLLGIAKQLVMVKPNQNRWHKIASALGNVGFFTYYLFDQFAAWVLDFHDFDYAALEPFEAISFQISGGDELSALQNAAAYVLGGSVGCASDGAIILKRNPQYESTAYNSGLDERWTIDGDHVQGTLEYRRSEMSRIFDAKGGFRISSATGAASAIEAYIARTNSGAPAQGTQLATIPDNIALSISDGLVRTGNYRQVIAAPTQEVTLSLVSLQDVIDPCRQGLYTLDLADYDPMQSRLFDGRLWVARRIDRTWAVAPSGEPLVNIRAAFAPVNRGVAGLIEMQPGVGTVDAGALTYALEFKSLVFFDPVGTGGGELFPEVTWGWEFDFRTSAMGFTGDTVYVAGQGHRSDLFINTANIKRRFVDVELSTGAGTLSDVYLYYLEYTATLGANPQDVNIYTYIDNSTPPSSGTPPVNGTTTVYLNAYPGSAGDGVDLNCLIGDNTGIAVPDPMGEITLHKLTAYGIGSVPSGWTLGSSVTPPAAGDYWEATDVTLAGGRKRKLIDIIQDQTPPYDTIANIAITFDLTIGTVVNDAAYCIQLVHARSDGTETILSSTTFAEAAGVYEGTNVEYIWVGRVVLKGLRIRLSSSFVNSGDTPDGVARLTNLSILQVASPP